MGIDSTIFDLHLRQILSDYGSPDKIFLRTFKSTPGDDFPLTLVLYYQDRHFIADYQLIAHKDNDELISCPMYENPSLTFWSKDVNVTDKRVQDWTLGVDPFIPLRPLEQVTDWDIAAFTDSFVKDDVGTQCIHTQREFWSIGN